MRQFTTTLPDGTRGKRLVLRAMSRAATAAAHDDPQIRQAAAGILRACPGWNTTPGGRAACLLAWVRRNLLFTPDPFGTELLQTPGATLQLGIGDCDDLTTLLLALARAVGIRARPVGQGSGGRFSHVAPQLYIGGRWAWADPSLQDARLGAAAPLPQCLVGPEE